MVSCGTTHGLWCKVGRDEGRLKGLVVPSAPAVLLMAGPRGGRPRPWSAPSLLQSPSPPPPAGQQPPQAPSSAQDRHGHIVKPHTLMIRVESNSNHIQSSTKYGFSGGRTLQVWLRSKEWWFRLVQETILEPRKFTMNKSWFCSENIDRFYNNLKCKNTEVSYYSGASS